MMPNKRNPDPAELVRGRDGRRHRLADRRSLTLLKGLPLAYQRDLQEDKPRVAVRGRRDHWEASLERHGRADRHDRRGPRDRMRAAAERGYTTATAVADALVRRGIPFRTAHHVVGSLVSQAEAEGLALDEVPDAMIGLALGAAGDDDGRKRPGPGAGDRRRDPGFRVRSRGRSRPATSSAERRRAESRRPSPRRRPAFSPNSAMSWLISNRWPVRVAEERPDLPVVLRHGGVRKWAPTRHQRLVCSPAVGRRRRSSRPRRCRGRSATRT